MSRWPSNGGDGLTSATLTASTELGRQAIGEVMRHSYHADLEGVLPDWARARVVDGVPVSFILVDPDRRMDFPGGSLRYAFIEDVATREDRRDEGHFRAIMEDTFASLREAGTALVLTHGRWQLYRRFGFDVFTHHCGIFATPDQIERRLGRAGSARADDLLAVEESRHVQPGLLLVSEVAAETMAECRSVLLSAAKLARERDRDRILFEHPTARSYGSRYPIHQSLETLFTALARTCGAEVRIQGADPESGTVPDADWIKILDVAAFLSEAVGCLGKSGQELPSGAVCFQTDAGTATIQSQDGDVTASAGREVGAVEVRWPSSALAQLVTGYRSTEVLGTIHKTPLLGQAAAFLEALFPPSWRLSRNESWTY